MAIRMSGLISGLDTESLVKELMSAQSMKLTKKENLKTKTEWKQEKWKDLNKKIYSLYTGKLSKMKTQGNYATKKVTSGDESAVEATAGNSAAMGNHTLEIKSLASAQYVTGAKITEANLKSDASSKKINKDSKLTDFEGMEEGTVITIKNKSGNITKTLEVTDETEIEDLLSTCQDAGLSASFDEKQGRFFISSKDSGADKGFTMEASGSTGKSSASVNNLKKSVYELIKYDELDTAAQTLMDGYFEEMDISEAFSAMETARKEYEDYQKTYDSLSEEEKADGSEASLKLDAYKTAYDDAVNVYEAEKADQEVVLSEMFSEAQNFAAVNTDYTSTEISEKLNAMKTTFQKEQETDSIVSNSALAALGLDAITGEDVDGGASGTTVRAASDAVVVLDGARMSGKENTMTVNGLTLNLKSVTNHAVSLNVVTNVDDIYNGFKDFIKEYNEVLKEMNDAYTAASARKYDVLTSEQKEAMTDEEVEKWEGKIKDSLLRRDSILGSLLSSVKSAMQTTVKLDSVTYELIDTTKKDSDGNYKQYNSALSYSLSSFGIVTSSDYTEGSLLHIYGDEDDELYASEENKLKKALEENPAAVQSVLSAVCNNLYNTLTDKMAATSISSAMTFYNDKELKSQISTYEDDLKQLQEKLNDQEDRYYSQFTAMEKAMSQAQSQSNSLSGMLGM